MQFFIHYFLHLVFPLFIALLFFKDEWKKAYFIMLASMLVDVDHLWANPVFQADRCSIGFHIFHSFWAIAFYITLLFFKWPIRVLGIGLLFHMLTDLIDCIMIYNNCTECLDISPIKELVEYIHTILV